MIREANSILQQFQDPAYKEWNWNKGVLFYGIWQAYTYSHDMRYYHYCKNYVDMYVDGSGNITAHNHPTEYVNNICPAFLLPELYLKTGDSRYLTAAGIVTDYLKNTVPRVSNSAFAHVNQDQLYIDTIFMVGMFLIQMGMISDDPWYFDEASRQILRHADKLFSEADSLFYHGWDEDGSAAWADPVTHTSEVFWARGNGWPAATLVELLEVLPKSHAKYDSLNSLCRKLLQKIASLQDNSTGLWYTVIDQGDRAGNYHETTATALFLYSIQKAVLLGILNDSCESVIDLGYAGLLTKADYNQVTQLCIINDISRGTSIGDYNYYVSIGLVSNRSYGMGAFLLAMSLFRPGFATIQIPDSVSVSSDVSFNDDWAFHSPALPEPDKISVPHFYVHQKWIYTFYFDESAIGPWHVVEGYPEAQYTKQFNFRSPKSNTRIFLRFEGVNYLSQIYLNGRLIHVQEGGYLPFELDVTDKIERFADNDLRVDILYDDSRFLDPDEKYPLWPTGFYGHLWNMGIIHDVYVVIKNDVYIHRTEIETSVKDSRIYYKTAIVNRDTVAHTVFSETSVEDQGSEVLQIGSQNITINPEDTVWVQYSKTWNDPVLWTPETPWLYDAITTLTENSVQIDKKSTCFGFREFKIEGTNLVLNNVPVSLRGETFLHHAENNLKKWMVPDSANWSTALDSMKSLNLNALRITAGTPPEWMIEACDKKGMFVIGETAATGRFVPYRNQTYVDNVNKWATVWVHQYRNHPSIVLWSASNEQHKIWKTLSLNQLKSFSQTIMAIDTTRPVYHDGDYDLEGYCDIYSYHYMYGFSSSVCPGADAHWPENGIYDMAQFVHSAKPTNWGEFEWAQRCDRHYWVRRQCVKTRTGRILGVSDIRPFRLDWSYHPNPLYNTELYGWQPSAQEVQYLKNTMAPVAIFDKAYYEFDPFPDPPEYWEAETLNRTFVCMNDEYADTTVTIQWYWLNGTDTLSTGQYVRHIALGARDEHVPNIPVPFVTSNTTLNLILETFKNEERKYCEIYPFWIKDRGMANPLPTHITIQDQNGYPNLTWPAVTQNEEGIPIRIDRYRVLRSANAIFDSQHTDTIDYLDALSYLDTSVASIGDTSQHLFYRIQVVDSAGYTSAYTDTTGDFEYNFISTEATDFNLIGLPFQLTATNTSQLMAQIPECNSVARFHAATQSYQQYVPRKPDTDFVIHQNDILFVSVFSDTLLPVLGNLAHPKYALIHNPAYPSWNTMMIRLEQTGISDAEALMNAVPNCDGVVQWNPKTQGYHQYNPAIPSTNFAVYPGHAYFVHVTANGMWPVPASGLPKQAPAAPDALSETVPEETRVPHLLWGAFPEVGSQTGDKQMYAWHGKAEADILTKQSPGCGITDNKWYVQCGSFQSSWKAGDTIYVQLQCNDLALFTLSAVLTWSPVDQIVYTGLEHSTVLPRANQLSQNYPNPFNSRTRIEYALKEGARIVLSIYDIRGRIVRTLKTGFHRPGYFQMTWDGTNHANQSVSSGVYFIQLQAGTDIKTQKMLLIR